MAGAAAMLLARDGHHVTVLERDPPPPPAPADAWNTWERRGVTQFRQPHSFLPRFREVLDDQMPDVADALVADGLLRQNRMAVLPEAITGGWRDGDERFTTITGRRPVLEAALGRATEGEPGVEVHRGQSVIGLTAAERVPDGIPHVTGVVTGDGRCRSADLVVDAGGRRSRLPDLLTTIGARRPAEELADLGYTYYGRHYRSADGSIPPMLGPPLQAYDSVSWATLPADNGTWSVVLVTVAGDGAVRAARHVEHWERIARSYPLIAHWLDAEPITGIDLMAGIDDRVRRYVVDGQVVATGLVAVGDALVCTNPSVGRGTSIAALHAVGLRDALRKVGVDAPRELIDQWHEITAGTTDPLIDDTLLFNQHRVNEMAAQIAGRPYETDDPGWHFGRALTAAAGHHPDLLRAAMSVAALLARGVEVRQWDGIVDQLAAVGPVEACTGPGRDELVAIAA